MTIRAQLRAALAVEWLKFRRARPVIFTTAFLVLGIPAMTVLTMLSLKGANPLLAGKAAAVIGDGAWAGLFTGAGTITAAGGLLGFGVVAGWVFGREFTDGTIDSLFLAAVSRTAIAGAKLLLVLAWAAGITLALTGLVLAAGVGLGLGSGVGLETGAGTGGAEVPAHAAKFAVITLATALLSLPCAWAASIGRGYLAAIATAIGLVLAAQMAVMAGSGGWFPFSAPGLWASRQDPGADLLTAVQVLLTVPVAVLAAGLTLRSWHRLTLS